MDREPLLGTARATEAHDRRLRDAYAYKRDKGLVCIVAGHLADQLVSAFILLSLIFLFGGAVDYPAMWARVHHPICPGGSANRAALYQTDCFGDTPVDAARLGRMPPALALVFACCVVGWVAELGRFVWRVPALLRTAWYYRRTLDIPERELGTMPWSQVMQRLRRIDGWTELEVVNCITRRTNFMVALYNDRVLRPTLCGRATHSRALQWAIDWALDMAVYSGNRVRVDEASVRRCARGLRRCFYAVAVAYTLLAPAILVYRAAYCVFRYAEEWRRHPRALTARHWTPWARWRLRGYCELDHTFETRLRRAYAPSTAYVGMFTPELSKIAARATSMLCGGFLAINVAFAMVFDEEYLTVELTPGRSVAFWMGIAGVVLAVAGSAIPGESDVFAPAEKLEAAAREIHHFPEAWRQAPEAPATHASFVGLFRYRVLGVLDELLSTFTAPMVLAWTLPAQAERIAAFFARNTRRGQVVGDVCRHALFEGVPDPKMELSVLKFADEYAEWTPPTAWQQDLVASAEQVMERSLAISV